jgi:hypothetical protein
MNVLPRTLDVRQIRRTRSGDEEGTRNEEQLSELYALNRAMTSLLFLEAAVWVIAWLLIIRRGAALEKVAGPNSP